MRAKELLLGRWQHGLTLVQAPCIVIGLEPGVWFINSSDLSA